MFQYTTTDCSAGYDTTVSPEGDVSKDTSIAIGEDGLAIIVYYETVNNDLKLVGAQPAITGVEFG